MTALEIFAGEQRWVTWRLQKRGSKSTKVPYSAHGGAAKADDLTTWATRAEAEAVARRFPNGPIGGIGIELGDLGGDSYLAGVDLDTCLADGKFAKAFREAARLRRQGKSFEDV
jgi:primase-polymerase (primpol)-like protein